MKAIALAVAGLIAAAGLSQTDLAETIAGFTAAKNEINEQQIADKLYMYELMEGSPSAGWAALAPEFVEKNPQVFAFDGTHLYEVSAFDCVTYTVSDDKVITRAACDAENLPYDIEQQLAAAQEGGQVGNGYVLNDDGSVSHEG
jgi:hypothetical protein